MATVGDVFDPFGLDEHEEEKAALPFDPFLDVPTVTKRILLEEEEEEEEESQQPQPSIAPSRSTDDARVPSKPRLLPPPPAAKRVTRTSSAKALPPKIAVKLVIREDATAIATSTGAGASHVDIVGTVQAQIQCSDATKNAPFVLKMEEPETMEINEEFVDDNLKVYIPKHEIGLVRILEFAVQQHIQRMPLLLERKISIKESMCRISIQVRSKLANKGDLKDLSIAIAVPMEVDGESISILRGDDGIYDELRRIVHWRLDELKRGESLMVAAEAQLWERPAKDAKLDFPVILRANSTEDKISEVDCRAVPAAGHPSSVTFTQSHSFRLLYRLQ